MEKVKRKFRLNVLVSYSANLNINNYQNPIHSILKNFAWLYKLDYSIDSNTKVFDNIDIDSSFYSSIDLIYFRSSAESTIDLKGFQKIIKDVFSYSNPFISGVEVLYQIQKHLKEYPFPNNFIRPLNYPYLEIFEYGKSEIKIPKNDLDDLFPTSKMSN
ncbi:hypothetical protein [Flavobacterium geliluteum]|uniref:Uncharacterized protein n=1 Tax=Flavobacterium geliluteum TaxID=2816120 RepID=A0A940X8V0_9FLAO|nr:hypothetical protein [Flavobacterium geliluteum]MBP4139159.1 hypothetical protein [Flavobacterium geliluteum]